MTDRKADFNGTSAPLRHLAPAVIGTPLPRAVISVSAPGAAFISQLIAEHQHLPPQRARRRASVDVAVSSYAEAQQQGVRRLPPGYRKNLSA